MPLPFLAGILLFMSASTVGAQILFTEDFNDADDFETSAPFFNDGDSDYFQLTTSPIDGRDYQGFSGSYLTGQDLDGEGALLPITLTWTNIDIHGYDQLMFSGLFAEFLDGEGGIDASDHLIVEYQIDGGGYETLIDFSGSDTNTAFAWNGLTLDENAQTVSATFLADGSRLDLRVRLDINAGYEDFGIDSFSVTAIPEPTTYALILGSVVILTEGIRRRKRGK